MRIRTLVAFIAAFAASLSAQTQPEIFNVYVYEGIYVDIMNAYGSGNLTGAFNHWTNQGLPVEGRRGSLEFDVKYYIANNPGVPTGYLAAADDFINFGLGYFGRRGSADFSVQDYINNYPDVAAGYGPTDYFDAMLHWLRRGKALGRHGFGALPPPTECVRDRTTEFVTVPAAGPAPTPPPPTVQIAHPTAAFADLSVFYVNPPAGFPAQLAKVTSSPAQGQYSVASNGTYTFNLADAEAPLQISYMLAPIPTGYSRIFLLIVPVVLAPAQSTTSLTLPSWMTRFATSPSKRPARYLLTMKMAVEHLTAQTTWLFAWIMRIRLIHLRRLETPIS